jgi:hypothetical protein
MYYNIILWDRRRICGPSLCGAYLYTHTRARGRPTAAVAVQITLITELPTKHTTQHISRSGIYTQKPTSPQR